MIPRHSAAGVRRRACARQAPRFGPRKAPRASMNRTATNRPAGRIAILSAVCSMALPLCAQESDAKPQPVTAESVVAAMREREAAVKTVVLELETSGQLAGGLSFLVRGSLRVLRAEQREASAVHTKVDYEFGDGLSGRVESVQTKDGILVLQQDPTFGESFVRIDAATVLDLEWAASTQKGSDTPFAPHPRSSSPLGADLFADLALRYDLRVADKPAPEGMSGTWWIGDRKKAKGLEDGGADLPLADRVEAFVRADDLVLIDVQWQKSGEVMQRVLAKQAVLGGPLALSSFRLDAGGKKPVDAKDHPPTWQQIEQTLQRASQAQNGEKPPSRR